MAIENLKKHIILALLFLIYHFWLYKNIARKNTIKLVLLSDTWERIPSSSLSLSLSPFPSRLFPLSHWSPFLTPQLQQQLRYAQKKLKKLKDPLRQLQLPSPLLLSWVSSKQSLSPPFHSIPFPFFSPHHPLQLDSRSAQLGGSCSLRRLKSHAFPFVSSFLHSFILSFFSFLGWCNIPIFAV